MSRPVYWIILLLSLCLIRLCFCESHYSVLGVSKHAKSKEIKKAYVKLAYKWHPDKNKDPNAPDMMAKINQAYEVLSDSNRKREYDLFGDSDYSGIDSGYSRYSRHKSPSSRATVEPSYKINTVTFMSNVLPDSITVPYLIYFYHDFSIQCGHWTKLLEIMKNDFQTIGVKMAAVDVIINTKVSTYCGIYLHEVPQIVLLLNKKSYLFKDVLSLDNLKEFMYTILPSRKAKHINDLNNVLSVKSRIFNNKPSVLLVSPRANPTINYKIVSFTYRMNMDFHFVSSSKSNHDLMKHLNLTEGDKRLYIYSDLNEPVTILEGDDLNREMTKNALEKHKFLTLPRINSCNMLDTLCQGGPNTRWCVLLVSDIGDNVTDEFRNLANKWSSRKFSMGYLNKNQQSTLMDAVSTTIPTVQDTDSLCDNEELSRPILLLHRLTIHKLEYRWYNGYCGTGNDNIRLLKMIQANQLNEVTIMNKCMFEIEDGMWSMLPSGVKEVYRVIQEFVWQYWEKIGAFISLPLPLLTMSCYLFLFPTQRGGGHQQRRNVAPAQQQPHHDDGDNNNNEGQESGSDSDEEDNDSSDSFISDSGGIVIDEDTINGDSHLYREENYNDNDDGNSSSERVVRLEMDEETADIVSGPKTVNTVTSKMTVVSRETSFEKRSITERQLISERQLIAERQLKMERQFIGHHQPSYSEEAVDSSNNVLMTSEINSIQDNSDLFDT